MAATTPFRNGLGAGSARADAVWKGPGRWQVFLFLAPPEGIRQFREIEAATAPEAIAEAWTRLRHERRERGI